MSLLDNGPHQVEVISREVVEDKLGRTVKDSTPVVVRGVAVQPVTADEATAFGVQAQSSYRVIGRGNWPGGLHSKVRVLVGPEAGRLFDQSGEARVYGMSRRTAHFDVLITARGAAVK